MPSTIVLRRAVVSEPQDRALGQDVHCLSTEGRTAYGAVARWKLEVHGVALDLTDDARATLGLPGALRTAVDDRAAAQLAEVLPRLLGPAGT